MTKSNDELKACDMPEEIYATTYKPEKYDEFHGELYSKYGFMMLDGQWGKLRPHPETVCVKYIRSDLAPTSQWRDISTAPRDGSKIILSIPEKYLKSGQLRKKKQPWICIGFWKPIDTETAIANGVNENRMKLAYKHGGYWTNHFRGEQPLKGEPSHFMPLPAPPTKDLADAGKEKSNAADL